MRQSGPTTVTRFVQPRNVRLYCAPSEQRSSEGDSFWSLRTPNPWTLYRLRYGTMYLERPGTATVRSSEVEEHEEMLSDHGPATMDRRTKSRVLKEISG